MPDNQNDVKPASSTGGVNGASPASDELAKTKADNERLKGALSSLQGERDEIKGRLEKLEEIETKYGELSAKQEAERKRLERGQDNVEDQIEELKRKPEAKPWFTHLEREMLKMKGVTANETLAMLAADYLEEQSEELAEKEEYKGMTEEKLWKLIKPFAGQFETKSPIRKAKLAFKSWQEAETLKNEKADAAKKKAEESLSREDSERKTRESSSGDLLSKNGNLSQSEKGALREKLGIVQRPK